MGPKKRNRNRNKKASPKPEASAVVDPTDLQNPPSVPEITPQDPVPCIAESSKSDQVQTNVPKSQSDVTAPSQANAEISKITEESNPQSCVIPPQEKTGIPKNKMPEAKKDEKSREEVMAEREAKKAAKKAAKGNDAPAKSKDQDHKPSAPTEEGTPPSPAATIAPKKSKEEILAEREAKKAEKAARRAKVLEGKDTTDGGKPKEVSKVAPAEKNKQAAVKTEESGKSKAELKAERRAKQEAQRASKMAAAAGGDDNKAAATATDQAAGLSGKAKISGQRVPDEIQADRASVEKKLQRKLASAKIPARTQVQRKVMMFSHLHQYERELSISRDLPVVGGTIHPAILQLGLRYAEGIVSGSNARCVALLRTFKRVISDYETPPQKELSRDLDSQIKLYITFLKQCRSLSVSMGNAIRFLKSKINALPTGISDKDAKKQLIDDIDTFVHHNIELAAKQISITARKMMKEGEVVLTYGCSSLIATMLLDARQEGKDFRVIVADGRPRYEGKELIRNLVNAGVECEYIQVSSVPSVIHEVTCVFLGAHAVLANGCVMSRVGSSQVALIAKAFNVPVHICCETYKFSERVQTDSFVLNELGDPDDLVSTNVNPLQAPLEDWRDLKELSLLNLTYDVTPASLVKAIISEISVIPTTSVPVVLRLKGMEYH